ncbi:MAG: hypothetical protein IPI78_01665 [Chitinophagaceae bacterium]|nr:hypothetical protein [Chitinophagaceae bacterium]
MIIQENKNSNKVSPLKKAVIITAIIVLLLGGIVAAIIAIRSFRNYFHPYLFGFTCGSIGLLIGLFVSNRLKSKIFFSPSKGMNYFRTIMCITPGIIGLTLLLGEYSNRQFAAKEKCADYSIVEKTFIKKGHKTPELNILVIDVEGTHRKIITSPEYFRSVYKGKQINACIHKGRIGFDFLTLTNDN